MSDVALADLNPTPEEMASVLEVLRAKREMPPRDHGSLILAAWIKRDIPARDYLLGGVLCTTSRWFVIGETGVGKTLFGAELGACCAKGVGFLNWKAGRPCRVMYIDGELPVETFKERMQLIASRHGPGLQFFGYNREYLGYAGMPPFNTTAGQVWLWREIDIIKPDLIIFDSIMCLLVGKMSDEEAWIPVKPFGLRAFRAAHRANMVQPRERSWKELRRQNPRMGNGYRRQTFKSRRRRNRFPA
jgi:hypothetical protein